VRIILKFFTVVQWILQATKEDGGQKNVKNKVQKCEVSATAGGRMKWQHKAELAGPLRETRCTSSKPINN